MRGLGVLKKDSIQTGRKKGKFEMGDLHVEDQSIRDLFVG